MSEVKRYKVDDFRLDNPTTARTHLMVHAELFDAQRLRADTAEAELKIVRKSRDDELENYNSLIAENAGAEQRIADTVAKLELAADMLEGLERNPEAESHE